MRTRSVFGGLAASLALSTVAEAAIVVDQSQLTGDVSLAGVRGNSHPVQSFQTSAGNVAGGGFYVGSIGGDDPLEFTIALWDALPNVGALLASGTATATSPEQWIEAFWAPVSVLAGTTYYLSIDVAGGTLSGTVAGVFRADPYTQGELFLKDAGGPNYQTYSSDTKFRTYADVPRGVPEPATWALMILGFGSAGAMLRRSRSLSAA